MRELLLRAQGFHAEAENGPHNTKRKGHGRDRAMSPCAAFWRRNGAHCRGGGPFSQMSILLLAAWFEMVNVAMP
jgi:hypothetical protein